MKASLKKNVTDFILRIGYRANDSIELRSLKIQLTLLALLMSVGGIVWGTLLAWYGLYHQALIPYGYVILSALNLLYFHFRQRLIFSIRIQIAISMILPFMLQWFLGGFFSSGVVMLWSSLALIGSISLLRGTSVYPWLILYLGLTVTSFLIDPIVLESKPLILTYQTSLVLLLINVTMIVTIIFVLSKARADKDVEMRLELGMAYDRLQAAKEKVEESSRMKSVFLGSLSHEVRTPLQGILGMAELLESSKNKITDHLEYVQIIKRRANDLQSIIEALLDMASLESGELHSSPETVDLRDLIAVVYKDVSQDYELSHKPVKLILENNLSQNSKTILDKQHLRQVLNNLIGNAIKFTNQGEVKLVAEKTETGEYRIHVIDTGIGIPQDKLEHIFMPFRQAHEGLSRSKGGIGLGLAICTKLIGMWGGRMIVKSTLNHGSTFTVTVPGNA